MADSSILSPALPVNPGNDLDDKLYQELQLIYNAIRTLALKTGELTGIDDWETAYWNQLSYSQMIGSLGARLFLPATVALAYGDMVNIFNSAGVLSARKADATTIATMAWGVCNVVGGTLLGGMTEILLPKAGTYINSVGGMVKGTHYFMSTTPGIITNVAPVAAGTIKQTIGLALSPTEMLFTCSSQVQVN